jgi:transcriptional regulator with XRE-family HTH domain
MELGLTSRAVAATAKVSSATIKRLEERGDAGVLSVNTLTSLLNALSLTLLEVVQVPSAPESEEDFIRIVGNFLAGQKKGIPLADIAIATGLLLVDASRAADTLEMRLREVGMCINHSATGLKIVPTACAAPSLSSAATRSRYLKNLNNGDLALLYRIFSSVTHLNAMAQSPNTTMSLQKLEGAGLIEMPTNQPIRLTHRAAEALGYAD